MNDDLICLDTKSFSCNLRKHSVSARPQIGSASQQIEAAIFVHLDRRRAHINAGNARCLHADDHPESASKRSQFTRAGLGASLFVPADCRLTYEDAFLDAARPDNLRIPVSTFAKDF